MTADKIQYNKEERGNALFLILIAVALFAALSYAITESGRGGGTIDKETVMITAGEVVQQPAGVRTAVTRMVVTGTPVASITFTGAATSDDVFDNSNGGGGATNVPPPTAACVAAADCAAWVYIPATSTGVGTYVYNVGTNTGDEALAVLQGTSGVTLDVCNQINKGLGFSQTTYATAPPVGEGGPVKWVTPPTGGSFSATGNNYTVKSTDTSLDGQDFACFQNTTANLYAYYHTLYAQ